MRRVCFILSLMLFFPVSPGAASEVFLFYYAKPIQGTVVDAQTGQPLEGVIVVAQWILAEIHVAGVSHRKRFRVLETVTAKDGTYAFPGWGPKLNLSFRYALDNYDPQLNFFKPGYRPLMLVNQLESQTRVRASEWDGKTIRMEKFTGSPEEWAKELREIQSDLAWGYDEMDWGLVPRMTLAVLEERKKLPGRLPERHVLDAEILRTTEEEIRRFLETGKK